MTSFYPCFLLISSELAKSIYPLTPEDHVEEQCASYSTNDDSMSSINSRHVSPESR